MENLAEMTSVRVIVGGNSRSAAWTTLPLGTKRSHSLPSLSLTDYTAFALSGYGKRLPYAAGRGEVCAGGRGARENSGSRRTTPNPGARRRPSCCGLVVLGVVSSEEQRAKNDLNDPPLADTRTHSPVHRPAGPALPEP